MKHQQFKTVDSTVILLGISLSIRKYFIRVGHRFLFHQNSHGCYKNSLWKSQPGDEFYLNIHDMDTDWNHSVIIQYVIMQYVVGMYSIGNNFIRTNTILTNQIHIFEFLESRQQLPNATHIDIEFLLEMRSYLYEYNTWNSQVGNEISISANSVRKAISKCLIITLKKGNKEKSNLFVIKMKAFFRGTVTYV